MARYSIKLDKDAQNIQLRKLNHDVSIQLRKRATSISLNQVGRKGQKGDTGSDGADGVGVPIGGTTNQVLAKASSADFDTKWVDATGGGGGGGAVDSVNGKTGVVVLNTDDIQDTVTNRYTNGSDVLRLANTSGVNTGDQDLSGYALISSLADVATSGDYADLDNKPTIPGSLGDLSGTSDDVAEGSANLYMTSLERSKLSGIEAGAEVNTVNSVNTQTGTVVLDADDIDDTSTTHKFATSTQLNNADSAIQPGDNISELTNDSGFTSNTGTVTSVGITGTDGIEVDSGSPITTSGSIQLGLSATVQGQLSDASTAVQPGDLATVATSGDYDDLTNKPAIPSTFDDLTDGTTNKAFTSTLKNKLDGIEAGAEVNTVGSVNGQTGAVTLDADDVLPTQTGNSGKYLGTNGTTASWQTLAGGGDMAAATYDPQNIADDAFDRANHTGQQTASTISDFDTEVSGNSDVSANTAARHAAVTVTDSSEIDFTLTGQDITASLKAASIDESKLDSSVNASLDLADTAVQNLSDLGITATATELNYVDGVTSAIQTQFNNKQPLDADLTALAAAGNSAVLSATTASFLTADETKLDGIEALADVTDATNVAAAGAVMDTGDETIAGVKTFSSSPVVPTPTTDMQAATKKYVDDNAGGAVDSVNTQTGTVVLDADDIDDTSTSHKFVTSTDIAKLGNLSGTNTGDQDLSGLVPNTRTINGDALSSNITLTQDDIGDGSTYKQYSQTEKNKLAGIETGAEVNTVNNLSDLGITATSAELNLLDGVTATTTEINYIDGVTSAIQTQLNSKVNGTSTIAVGTTAPGSPSIGDIWIDTN